MATQIGVESRADRGAPVLEARGLVKRFPGVLALSGVDLALHRGEVHALVGENGAGKSTLIKMLTGAYRPDEGTLLHRGAEVSYSSPRDAQDDGISTIYQEVNLVPLMSVARNLYLGREPRRFGLIDTGRMERDARALLTRYGIEIDVRAPLRSLGLGAQQMVAVARAVSTDADTVIMDEPTSSLETREVETLFGLVERLKAAGAAILYVSHRLDELFRLCDQVTVLRDGRLVHSGPLAAQSRLTLVSMMLGRELEQVQHGTTAFGEGHAADAGEVPVLEVRGLARANVLHGIDLAVRPGEVVGLGGLLGAGRSETARSIAGADPLDAGEVVVNGTAVPRHRTAAALRAGIAMLPEDRKSDGIVPGLSVRDNIALAALPRLSRAGVVSEKAIDRLVETFMKRLSIRASSPQQKVGELSGGNQQKVLLARLLCLEPKVLLLDEPTRGIDVGAKAEVQGLVEELAEQGLAVLLISSELEELVEGSDRIVVLRDGAVVDVLSGDDVDAGHLMSAIATGTGVATGTPSGAATGTVSG